MPQVIQLDHIIATTPPRRRNKLTEDDIISLRAAYADGRASAMQLAESYDCTYSNVLSVVKRRTWKHI